MNFPTAFRGVIPEHVVEPLLMYVEGGIIPGGFLVSVLSNDLMGATSKADNVNKRMLTEICKTVYNEIPHDAWGSWEKVKAWNYKGGLYGYEEAIARMKARKMVAVLDPPTAKDKEMPF